VTGGGAHRRGARLAAVLALALLSGACGAAAPPPAGGVAVEPTRSFAPVVERVSPAVVAIAAERTRQSPLLRDPLFRRFLERMGPGALPPQRQTSLGSGVIVDPSGLVVTNHHVVEGADAIAVVLSDERAVEARVVRADPTTDLALLRLAGVGGLPAVRFADSDELQPGDFVLALGNPFGVGQSVSSGIVSAVGRRARGLDLDVPLIQTDAAINPGNSGGPLVDVEGRLVGINTAILTRSGGSVGVGFAIPANAVRTHLENARGGGST
jgi:S1-C subfamily serine protease